MIRIKRSLFGSVAALITIYPLWAFTPVDKGGLGALESSIGLQMSIRGLLHVLTMAVYPVLEKRLGLYKLYAWTMAMWVLTGLGFPILNLWARVNGSTDGFMFQALLWTWFTIVSRFYLRLEDGLIFGLLVVVCSLCVE
jgi:hypothetical protein